MGRPKGSKNSAKAREPEALKVFDRKNETVRYPYDGFDLAGESRPPRKGEWFIGLIGYPRQAGINYEVACMNILITVAEKKRRDKELLLNQEKIVAELEKKEKKVVRPVAEDKEVRNLWNEIHSAREKFHRRGF